MYKSFIAPMLIVTLTGTTCAAEKSKHGGFSTGAKFSSDKSKYSVSAGGKSDISISHVSKPTPSLSASRVSGGMGSAFTPGFVHSIAKHHTIGTVSAGEPAPGASAVDLSRISLPTSGSSTGGGAFSQANMRATEYHYSGGNWKVYNRRTDSGKR